MVNFWECADSSQGKWKYDFETERINNLVNKENPCLDVLMSIKEAGTPI
jgi:hypothetical protein